MQVFLFFVIFFCFTILFFLHDIQIKCIFNIEGRCIMRSNTTDERTFNKEIGLKLFNARKNKRMSRAALGKIVNLHESTIKRYEDGEIKTLDIEKMKEFAKALDISPEYLMGWSISYTPTPDGYIHVSDEIPGFKKEEYCYNPNIYDCKKITVYGKVCAGDGTTAFEDPIDEIFNPYPSVGGEVFALQVHGDSMDKVVHDGMYAIFKRQPIVENGEIAALLLDGSLGMLKRFYYVKEADTVILKPDSTNPTHQALSFSDERINEITILGKLIGFISPLMK